MLNFYIQWPHNLNCEWIRNSERAFQGLCQRSTLPGRWRWDFLIKNIILGWFSYWWFSCCFLGLSNRLKWKHYVNSRAYSVWGHRVTLSSLLHLNMPGWALQLSSPRRLCNKPHDSSLNNCKLYRISSIKQKRKYIF